MKTSNARRAQMGSGKPLAWVGLALLGACASAYEPPAPVRSTWPTLTVADVTAPVERHGIRELEYLKRQPKAPAARLREAYVLLETGQGEAAVRGLNRLLYGDHAYGATVEAFARFLRAEVFERTGEPDRAGYERRLASQLPVDATLRIGLEQRFGGAKTTRPRNAASRKPLGLLAREAWNADPARRGAGG